jgi:hypothetical protein
LSGISPQQKEVSLKKEKEKEKKGARIEKQKM